MIVTHSWFISVVDINDLCPVKPVQLNQSKYENYENEGVIGGHDVFQHTYPFIIIFLEFHVRCSL